MTSSVRFATSCPNALHASPARFRWALTPVFVSCSPLSVYPTGIISKCTAVRFNTRVPGQLDTFIECVASRESNLSANTRFCSFDGALASQNAASSISPVTTRDSILHALKKDVVAWREETKGVKSNQPAFKLGRHHESSWRRTSASRRPHKEGE